MENLALFVFWRYKLGATKQVLDMMQWNSIPQPRRRLKKKKACPLIIAAQLKIGM